MGRYDDALRRANAADSVFQGSSRNETTFQSPWVELAEGRPAPVRQDVPHHPGDARASALRFNPEWSRLLTVSSESDPALLKQFGRLAGSLHSAQTAGGMKSVLTTSVGAGEGKTLTAMNVALTLSESYKRQVLIIDADLRRPSVHTVCGLGNVRGLSEGLRASEQERLAIIKLTETLSFLPAGRPDPDPMDGLTSDRMRRILDEASKRFDWVVLDAPPIGLVPDAGLLAAMVDAVLFVVRAEVTPNGQLQKAIEAVGRERIFGVVLNGAREADSSDYGTYYHSHSSSEPSK
jgi:capsular exopolysaccharide synthesis family protein